jgi:hypothetical protein
MTDLDKCGFPLCKGNIMASNPELCLTLEEWEERFARWVRTPEPQALLNATIFFDFRPLYGRFNLAHRLRLSLLRHDAGQSAVPAHAGAERARVSRHRSAGSATSSPATIPSIREPSTSRSTASACLPTLHAFSRWRNQVEATNTVARLKRAAQP